MDHWPISSPQLPCHFCHIDAAPVCILRELPCPLALRRRWAPQNNLQVLQHLQTRDKFANYVAFLQWLALWLL